SPMTISSSETTTGVFEPAMTAAAMSPSTAPMIGRMATTQGWSNRLSFSIGSPKGRGNRAASEPNVGRRKPRATPRPTHTRPMTMMSVRPSLKTAGPEGVPGLLSMLTAILTLRNWDTIVPNWYMTVPLVVFSLMKEGSHVSEGAGMRRLGREGLLKESLSALAEDSQASMLEIASAIGVGRTTLYRHFGDRETLVAEVARLGARRFGRAVLDARPESGTGLEAVERMCERLFTLPEVL